MQNLFEEKPVVVPKKTVNTPIVKKTMDNDEYFYHWTDPYGFSKIKEEWIIPQKRWVSSLSKTEEYSRNFAFPEATGTKWEMLRVKKDFMKWKLFNTRKQRPKSDEMYEVLTKQTIPPEAIEVLKDGKWKPLITPQSNAKQQGIKPKSTTTNVFGETIDKPSNKKGGFIKIPEMGKKSDVDWNIFNWLEWEKTFKKNWVTIKVADEWFSIIDKKIREKLWLNENEIFLDTIYSENKWKWEWTKILKELTNYADKNWKHITVTPIAENTINQKRLTEWYKNIWFEEAWDWKHLYYKSKSSPVKNPLVEEARKYKSAEEFVKNNSLKSNRITSSDDAYQKWWYDGVLNIVEDADNINLTLIELKEKWTWKWTEIVKELKQYADANNKKLKIINSSNDKYWNAFKFFEKWEDWRYVYKPNSKPFIVEWRRWLDYETPKKMIGKEVSYNWKNYEITWSIYSDESWTLYYKIKWSDWNKIVTPDKLSEKIEWIVQKDKEITEQIIKPKRIFWKKITKDDTEHLFKKKNTRK